MSSLPSITWPDLLGNAPYFSSALADVLTPETAPEAPPLARAAYYYGLFDGEISNGGVMQYFFNLALYTPGFDQIPAFIAANPVLAPALPFVEQVHAAWAGVAPQVTAARDTDEWPERLFSEHGEQFEALEAAFFATNHEIAHRLNADIVANPHSYFAIQPIDELPEKGTAHVVLRGGTCRLRFEDGFPVGPNMFENRDGGCDVVWFSRDRQLLQAESGYMGSRTRSWIHYPSQASGDWRGAEDGTQTSNSTRALWTRHGLSETFRADGSLEYAEFSLRNRPVWREFGYYPDGTPNLRIEDRDDGEHCTRRWPDGSINVASVTDPEGRQHYSICRGADGQDLAPGGTGKLYEYFGEEDGRVSWREGQLVDGYPEGTIRWWESAADGSDARETGRAEFRKGMEG